MKNLKPILAIVAITCLVSLSYGQAVPKGHQLYKQAKIQDRKKNQFNDNFRKARDRALDRIFYELDRTHDPKTGKVPDNIRDKEEEFTEEKLSLSARGKSHFSKSQSNWVNRGPYNVGGRTRALAMHLSNENVILAGGVSGGMWRSNDGGQAWIKVTRQFQTPSVTTIAQDPRSGYHHLWYYGGGELLGNSANAGNFGSSDEAFYYGAGIYKSQDEGRTWELLPATATNNITQRSSFSIINKIIVNPLNGHIYAATGNGIHKSIDGGTSFKRVLIGNGNDWTHIDINAKGRLYAAIDSAIRDRNPNPNAVTGIFTSLDGENWVNISRQENVFNEQRAGRSVFGINPANENEIYVYTADINTGAPKLYRYNHDQQTKWVELTNNLPNQNNNFSEPVGILDTQGGYNMLIKVHPNNPSLVIIGGTNLYRSLDGFTTPVVPQQNSWIGGYSPKNDISIYPNHHPDQHELIFYPSNPNRVLSANDAGVFVTEDITRNFSQEEPINWITLNHGYLTNQPYAVSYDPKGTDKDILVGFQDNGSWFINQANVRANWIKELGGDGSYNAIADGGLTRYSSFQFGAIFRVNYDDQGNEVSFARVQPNLGQNSFSFINPFILDPINDNIMYLPVGRVIYKNTNLDEIPTGSEKKTNKNWERLSVTQVKSITGNGGRQLNKITALDISRYPEPDKLYYGTGQGQLFRLDYVNTGATKPVDIFTNKGLPANAFVNSIHIDPSNSDRVVVSFSNYNIPSIFYTEDAGNTWANISGNLEESPDGTGNGPSVRSVSFLGNNQGIFAGTSTGLYFTNRLEGINTVWRLNSDEIGNNVVVQVKSRKDGYTIAAAHGNGVYSKKFNVLPQPENTLAVVGEIENVNLPIETRNTTINLEGVFEDSKGNPIRYSTSNANPDFITITVDDNKLLVNFNKSTQLIPNHEKEGRSEVFVFAESNGQKVATKMIITTFETPIFRQFNEDKPLLGNSEVPSIYIVNDPVINAQDAFTQSAENLIIPKGEKWSIRRIKPRGGSFNPNLRLAQVIIYDDSSGKPGNVLMDSGRFPTRNPNDSNMDLILPTSFELSEGSYWISIVAQQDEGSLREWYWLYQIQAPNDAGNDAYVRDQTEEFVFDSNDWLSYNNSGAFFDLNGNKVNLVYDLFGNIEGRKSNKQIQNDITIFPNPSDSRFTFKFSNSNEKPIIRISDISGKIIFNKQHLEKTDTFIWDASDKPSGIYFVNIIGASSTHKSKLILK